VIPDPVTAPTKAGHIQRQIRWAQNEEAHLLMHGDRLNQTYLPFMPYQIADFCAVLIDCIAETTGPKFLDVGCGTGTKMVLARELFGLEVQGIERDTEMAARAASRGLVTAGDALWMRGSNFYGQFDIIWLYRPFRDADKEDELETVIKAEMKHGAILAGGAWESCPGDGGWQIIVDDWSEMRRGAWQKP
jgi:SAM-dependent methyltransferase